MSKLSGKVPAITGGSSGIGLATAQRFVAEGAYVFITGRRQTELDKAKALIGKNVTAANGDVAILNDLDRGYETIGKEKVDPARLKQVIKGKKKDEHRKIGFMGRKSSSHATG